MGINVKPVASSTTKYAERAVGAATEYAKEAAAAAGVWAANTAAATDNYKQAITAPGIEMRFRRGVQKAGAEKYGRKIADVAKDRYGPGIESGKVDYTTGVEPYFATLAAMTLSPRKPRGDIGNEKRMSEVTRGLHAKRLAVLSTTG